MRPDRIILGEMRSVEVTPFILSMNNGHKGLMSTIHSSSAKDSLARVALLFSLYSDNQNIDYTLIMKLICSNIDCVIHIEDKRVKEVIRVLGSNGEVPYFEDLYRVASSKASSASM
jgi:Flp pilus assembly CpaF family ATPase